MKDLRKWAITQVIFVHFSIQKLEHCSLKLNFRLLTSKEFIKPLITLTTVNKRDQEYEGCEKGKHLIGAQLQLIFTCCIQNINLPSILNLAYVTPNHKNGQPQK